ncbi:FAD binding domain-containing protein [Desulfosporosinus sp.]|uniref:FAD binding domain-containing protein n=1 Tax=Desulfosporosinus sp. TaxID=157907 RepID=UPI0025B819A7|nr:FAD binding domain-containing protein [Desulfosporosinus sp.]MBC2721126.1 FAD binding domain-containing protein [Desulfosporosinus sp.]MBC2725551.1 FAD binding domain-containing protein [Desulfosporosinus sp.]
MQECQFICPSTVSEGIETISRINEDVLFISGGTDLVIKLQGGQVKPVWLMDISLLPELKFIKEDDGRIRIGSGATFAQISESDLVREKARCLSQAASQVGSAQIRNRATLGGNIANASPAGDSLPALLVLEAWVSVIGPQGFRRIPFAQLQAGGDVGLQGKELITEIDFPVREPQGNEQILSVFGKVGSRTAVSIARLNMAALLEFDAENQRILNSRWAVGALGRTPFRLEELEREIQGKRINPVLAQEIADHLTGVVDQAIPGRASQEYKRQAIRGLAYDLLEDLFPLKLG